MLRSTVSRVLLQLEQMIISDDWTRPKEETGGAQGKHQSKRWAQTSPNIMFLKLHFFLHVFRKFDSPRLNELGRTLVTSYSLKAYVDLLGGTHRQAVANWLYSSASSTIGKLFR